MTIRSEIAHTAIDSPFEVLIAVASEIKKVVERQNNIYRYSYLERDLVRAVEWTTAATIYKDFIDRSVMVEQEEDERYSWAHDEIAFAVSVFNSLCTNIPIELVIEQDDDEEVYVVLESEGR